MTDAPRTSRRRCTGGVFRLVIALTARSAVLSVFLLLVWSAVPAALGWAVTTVVSGSMEPSIRVGDVVAAMPIPREELVEGRVLLVADPDHAGRLRLHRLDSIQDDGRLVLRGDANRAADSSPVPVEDVRGAGVLLFPGVGLPGLWVRTGDTASLALAVGCVLVMLTLCRADDALRRGLPCARCGTPRATIGSPEPTAPATRGAAGWVAVGLLVCAVVSVSTAGAAFSASTEVSMTFTTGDARPDLGGAPDPSPATEDR